MAQIFRSLNEALDDISFSEALNNLNLDYCFDKLTLNAQYELSNELWKMEINPLRHVATIGRQCLIPPDLKKLIIPDTVEEIPAYLCYGHLSLEEVVMEKGVKNIGISAFCNCINLKHVYLPDGLEQIQRNAFSRCQNLGHIKFPYSIYYIDLQAFRDCTNLKYITSDGTTEMAIQNNYRTHIIDILDSYKVPCKELECINGKVSKDDIQTN